MPARECPAPSADVERSASRNGGDDLAGRWRRRGCAACIAASFPTPSKTCPTKVCPYGLFRVAVAHDTLPRLVTTESQVVKRISTHICAYVEAASTRSEIAHASQCRRVQFCVRFLRSWAQRVAAHCSLSTAHFLLQASGCPSSTTRSACWLRRRWRTGRSRRSNGASTAR